MRRLPERLANAALGALLLAGALTLGARAHAEELKPYQATYNGIWHGMTVAVSNLKFEQSGDTWTYSSVSRAQGVGRFVSDLSPNQTSVVKLTATGIQPQSYTSGASNGGKVSVDLKYNWESRRVTGIYDGATVDLELTPEMQDDASVQLALMVELLHGRTPDSFQLIDKDSVREYQFTRDGEETVTTPMGSVATVIYRAQKKYSPRITSFWLAPDRGFIPMKVEQKKGKDVQWTLQIQKLSR